MRRELNGATRSWTIAKALQYVRFTRLNRALHIAMIVSFMTLALTGLTLKFSYTAWASTLSHILSAGSRRPATSTAPRRS